jgi:hypothetical protein
LRELPREGLAVKLTADNLSSRLLFASKNHVRVKMNSIGVVVEAQWVSHRPTGYLKQYSYRKLLTMNEVFDDVNVLTETIIHVIRKREHHEAGLLPLKESLGIQG